MGDEPRGLNAIYTARWTCEGRRYDPRVKSPGWSPTLLARPPPCPSPCPSLPLLLSPTGPPQQPCSPPTTPETGARVHNTIDVKENKIALTPHRTTTGSGSIRFVAKKKHVGENAAFSRYDRIYEKGHRRRNLNNTLNSTMEGEHTRVKRSHYGVVQELYELELSE